jgi:drug/metabolite transporter (DMT)-like permease
MNTGIIYVFLSAVIFTTLEPASKLITGIHPLVITCLRFLIGGLILLPFSITRALRKHTLPGVKECLATAALGALCVCVSMPLLQYSVVIGDSPAIVAIIFSSNSIFTVLLSVFVIKEKFTPKKAIAALLCISGILAGSDFRTGTGLWSILCAVGAALTFSCYTVFSRKMMSRLSGIIQTGFSFLAGSLILLVVIICAGIDVPAPGASLVPKDFYILLYLGIVVVGAGYWAFFSAMEKTSTMAASLVFFIKPVLTPFVSFLITGEPFAFRIFAALALVVAGSFVIST